MTPAGLLFTVSNIRRLLAPVHVGFFAKPELFAVRLFQDVGLCNASRSLLVSLGGAVGP